MEEERGQEEKQKKKKRGRETLVREFGGAVLLSATGCQCVHTVTKVNAEPQFTGQSRGSRSVSLGVRMGWDGMGEGRGGRELGPARWSRFRQQFSRHKTATLQILVWIPTRSESLLFSSC